MRRTVLVAAAAATAMLASTPAFAADVLTHISSQGLSDMLTAAGAQEVKITKPEAGVEIVSFSDGNGPMDFVLLNCAAEGCASLQMTVTFNKDDRITLAAINSYNATYLNAQAAQQKDGVVTLSKLYVPVGGVTEDNLKVNMAIFFKAPDIFAKHVLSQVTASLDKPVMKPASAPANAPVTLNIGSGDVQEFDMAKWRLSRPSQPKRNLP